ncbi:multidrug resistance-associated protein 4-like [Branchiostoma floridae]|uniref:Multidrug resistance-associated protein 4-like n=1 Tax=Branchiostoma floridae TaxID=7739 RepID=A0A9J7MA58_BRAFL|nr:multidrug resistance-associated protein 4-like [Branchiostoma floridae]
MVKKRRYSKSDIRTDLQDSFGSDVFGSDDKASLLTEKKKDGKKRSNQDARGERRNPMETANWFSKLFFCWANAIVATGYKRRLENADLYPLREKDTSLVATDEFRPYWERELKEATPKKPASLPKALFRCYGLRYILIGIMYIYEEAAELIEPIIMGYIIQYFQPGSTMTLSDVYMYAGILAAVDFFEVIIGYYEWPVSMWGWNMGTALCNLVYEKVLRLSTGGLAKTSTGQVVNIFAEDVDGFEDVFDGLHDIWMGPLLTIVISAYLINFMGVSILAGFAYIVVTLVIDLSLTPLHIKYGVLENQTGDARVDMMNQILQSIRMIKLQAWEKPFTDVINKLRKAELWIILKGDLVMGVSEIIDWLGFDPPIFLIILTYVLTGNELTAEKVFVMMAYMELLEEAVDDFPDAIEELADAKVSVDRLQTFLALDEQQPLEPDIDSSTKQDQDRNPSTELGPKGVTVDINTARWKKSTTLRNIKVDIKEGELIVVIGPTGAGKTALLCTILRELSNVDGKVDVRGTLAFAAQEPWAYPDTIKNNIVDFGKPFDQEKYDRAVSVCKMERDISRMSHGDETYIGDRGVTLSGGQKARLSLARAVYIDADIYLLDDPLSAVDAAVGRKLFNKCILGELGSKARILVTHQMQFLKKADKILVLDQGKQVAFGTYEEVAASGVDFTELMTCADEDLDGTKDEESSVESFYGSRTSVAGAPEKSLAKSTNFVEEEREGGSVGWRVYYKYLTSGPPTWVLPIVVFVLICFEGLDLFSDWWLAHWVDNIALLNDTLPTGELRPIPGPVSLYHLKVYAILEGLGTFLAIVSPALLIYVTYVASVNLHNMMFNAVIRAPINFFDKNPSGRILNRFADDLGEVEDEIPEEFIDGVETLLGAIGAVAMVCIANPWAILPAIPLFVAFILMYIYFIPVARHLARLDATNSSPIYTHASSVMDGLWTIRALSAQENFKKRFRAIVDRHNEVEFLDMATEAWYEVRMELLNAVFVTCVTFLCIFSAESLGAGIVGLTLTYALSMDEHCEEIVESMTEMEGVMIHAERVLEYVELEPEAPWETDHKPPPGWPSYGAIDLDGVYLSYDEHDPPVLRNINLNIVGGEKVGIVGRTGAGKSSLFTALMRLVEPAGSIRIDGVDISKLGLHDLRKKISVIPQDPTMIKGSLRRNLDPLDVHSDHALWTALDEVNIAEDVRRLPYRLATEVGRSGSSFSVGQKQLLCLARTILGYNRILLIDEATANMDARSDKLVQKTIRERFEHCTVLTIAHRLNTVIDSDRILVMEDGRVAEFDEPHLLLTQYQDGVFSKLLSEVGESMERELREAARQSYLQKHVQQKS